MIRIIFALAFLLGAGSALGMSYIFLGSDVLALSVTLIIAFVYGIGAIELVQFHKATQSLQRALGNIPIFSANEKLDSESLSTWLDRLHASVKYAVHSRIEGESKGLPSPLLTPYLVGLLVMLGLLGTFIGMVDTLQGSVIALEGSTELSAIREGLAAPIKGLGAAFGTSVAGVATSAMLGLMSTLSRRERIFVTRELDSKINTVFRPFSLNYNRQETYKSLQQQAKALPELAAQIALMAKNLEGMGQRLGQELNTKQDNFHGSVEQAYKQLASSVNQGLNKVVKDSGQLVAQQMSPVVDQIISELSKSLQQHVLDTQTQLVSQSETYLARISKNLEDHTLSANEAWQEGVKGHEAIQKTLSSNMHETLTGFSDDFQSMSQKFIEQFIQQAEIKDAQRQVAEDEKLVLWTETLQASQTTNQGVLAEFSEQQSSLWQSASSSFVDSSKQFSEELNLAVKAQQDSQKKVSELIESSVQALHTAALDNSQKISAYTVKLNEASELSLQKREQAELNWQNQHAEAMNDIALQLKEQLSELRDQEQLRADKALQQLAQLETTVALQLADLGQALETPMKRLIDTSSEAPKAAAEVIAKLKEEMTQNMARDNDLLEERRRIMSDLDGLSDSLAQSTVNQGKAMETLLSSSGTMLAEISQRFDSKVEGEINKLSGIALQFSASSVDIASMSEAFVGAIERFSGSNDKLVDNLNKIETALEASANRSDEQLAYYVAQAREIIDHSMMSQKGLIEEINQMAVNLAEEQTDKSTNKRTDKVDA
jgi:hypothetical protein